MIVFDIETGPLPSEEIRKVLPPFDPSTVSHPGEFREQDVKLGNTKDEAKVAAKIDEARQKHADAIANYESSLVAAEASHWQAIEDKAALSAVTGQVVAIGYSGKKVEVHSAIDGVTERDLLKQFWKTYKLARMSNRSLVGFNCKFFDVPFLAQRSWSLGIEVPGTLLTATGYLDSTFVDLRDRWACGVRGFGERGYGTLDAVCRSCGLPVKPSDCCGADFAKMLWSEDPADREQAINYLVNDLVMTSALAERLGVS